MTASSFLQRANKYMCISALHYITRTTDEMAEKTESQRIKRIHEQVKRIKLSEKMGVKFVKQNIYCLNANWKGLPCEMAFRTIVSLLPVFHRWTGQWALSIRNLSLPGLPPTHRKKSGLQYIKYFPAWFPFFS